MEYLLNIALQDDEKGRTADASKMYSCAIELAIQAVSKAHFHIRNVANSFLHFRERECKVKSKKSK